MGIKHTIKKNASYYLTLTVVEWTDVFTRKNHKDAIIESLRYCIANKGLNIYSYCLMTNHLHMMVNCDAPFELKDVIRVNCVEIAALIYKSCEAGSIPH
jgi:REP element-mobilizing transposase RayT